MAALAGGLVALILGIIGIIVWWVQFIAILTGGVPIVFILGGALAAYLGFEEIKDKRTTETFNDTPDNLKQEVNNLKAEIKDLKKEDKDKEKTDS